MITIEQIIDLDPCYSRESIKELFARDHYEALCSIPAADARWLLSRLLPSKERIDWARACARRAHEYAEARASAEARAEAAAARAARAAAESAAAAEAAAAAASAARAAAAADEAEAAEADASAWAAEAADAARAASAASAADEAEHHIAIRHALLLLGVPHNG